jgi:RNA polymerase sigma-70 factor, ECF subfamily
MVNLARHFGIFIKPVLGDKSRKDLFEWIWREYQPAMAVFVRSITGLSVQDAEDLVQEIMLKVYSKLHLYNPLRDFRVWIYSIARNHCIDRFRKRAGPIAENAEWNDPAGTPLTSAEPNPEDVVIAGELHEIVESYLQTLGSEDRQISFLLFSERLPYKKIGQVLGIPPGTVKYRVHMIRAGLRKRLERYDEK